MLRISLNGSRIINVDEDPDKFQNTWRAHGPDGLLDVASTEGRVLLPARAITLIEVI